MIMEDTVVINPEKSAPYEVILNAGWGSHLIESLRKLKQESLFIITEKIAEEFIMPGLLPFLNGAGFDCEILSIEPGEENKHIRSAAPVYNRLIELEADRSSVLLAAGGGVTGDFTGFIAATFLRGVRFVQLPSTLLAAVDSSVGGKTAVNVDLGKNMVGVFHQPEFVYCNLELFRTLPAREWNCGLAEMAKHAFLAGGSMLEFLETGHDSMRDVSSESFRQCLKDNIAFKGSVVSQDENEKGLRAVLNLGHTTAHAVESATSYRKFAHGEAVSRGLATMLLLSRGAAGLDKKEMSRMLDVLVKLKLPLDTAGLSPEILLEHMRYDKKSKNGVPAFVLLEGPGRPVYGRKIETQDFISAWSEQKARFG